MKKFVKYLLVLCLIVPFAFMFAGCGEAKPANVMTMSVNPEVSFVLDANNNVISVKYNNADSSMIYADVNFVGKDVNTTVQLFIERNRLRAVSKSVCDNMLKVSSIKKQMQNTVIKK